MKNTSIHISSILLSILDLSVSYIMCIYVMLLDNV